MEATALGVPAGRRIHVAWLALICGLWHSHRPEFDALELKARMDNGGDEVWQRLGLDTVTRKAAGAAAFDREVQDHTVSVKDVGATYCAKANANLTVLRDRHDHSSTSYASAVMQELLLDAPQSYHSGTHYPTGLFDYFGLVRTAGHFKLS